MSTDVTLLPDRPTHRSPVADASQIGYESARERWDWLERKERALATDVDALYRRYGPMVLRRCRFLLRDEHQAVDAMQDGFVNVLRHLDALDTSAPSALLHKVATNVCLNRMRGNRRRPQDRDEALLLKIAALDDLEETAEHVGLSVSGVRKRLRTLKARLEALEEQR